MQIVLFAGAVDSRRNSKLAYVSGSRVDHLLLLIFGGGGCSAE